MLLITYPALVLAITVLWLAVRAVCIVKTKKLRIRRELQLLLVYICIIVAARFTFFPFGRVDGAIRPLIFDAAQIFPPRVNFMPLVQLFDYPRFSEAMLNLIGNIALFIPMGIVWPAVFPTLDSHAKAIGAGVGFTLFIEILQLLLFDRVTDIDDLLLNTAGYLIGYGIWLLAKRIGRKRKK